MKAELTNEPEIHVCDLYTAFLDTPGVQHAANFTGHQLRPAPPILNPMTLAKMAVELAINPSSVKKTDATTFLLKTSYNTFPKLTRSITTKVIDKYFSIARATNHTTGNLFAPTEFGTSVHGGWVLPKGPKEKLKTRLALAGILAGVFLLTKKLTS